MWHFYLVLLFVLLVLYLVLNSRRPAGFPPGPDWVPVVGNLLLFIRLRRHLGFTHLVWQRLAAQFGPVVGLRLGRDRIVVVSGLRAVRDALSRPEFDARPDGFFFRLRSFGKRLGLVFVEGEYFTEQKKFVMTHMKSFGLNRSVMENRIQDEIHDLLVALKDNTGEPVTVPDSFGVSVVNSLWGIVAGDRFRVGDSRPATLLSHIHTVFRLQDMSGGILNQMPYIRFIAPDLSHFNQTKMIVDALTSFLRELIQEHRKAHNEVPQDSDRDLIDAYLREIEDRKTYARGESSFSEDQLVILLLDLFLAGAETTNSTLGYAFLYLLHFPEWQHNLQKEIDSVVEPTEEVQMKHKINMKYTEIFLMELQRHANVTPTTVSHRASQDTEFMGFLVPQDTVILANLYSLHMDKEHWKDPDVFRPERFLDADGGIINDPWLMPFGMGKRKCIGESLAKTSLFLFLTNILHKFTISPVPGRPIPSLKGLDGATISPQSFKCVFTPK
ncbi:cytochrome P450 [Nesidiocoris tenuis]|uniref:Cytochrome P450 n=1 Tax=Nesidiocoris tenuis TaxID=355587 RepID=A0ABN7B8K9_9HEMI|nr:cytochrome P450 [Nesidiocoris tenuis]